ncbi:MAG: hypothetical protein K8T10_14525 [Candidatus Eremiobacteraeota bacterium]|nr:hypothetical protein [Candidatus Eremiobacteraeota bacterium]
MNTDNDKKIIITARTANSGDVMSRLKALGVDTGKYYNSGDCGNSAINNLGSGLFLPSRYCSIPIECSQCRENPETNLLFSLILAIILNICRELKAEVLWAEYYEEKNRSAVLVKADISNVVNNLHFLRESLAMAGNEFGVSIKVQKEDLFRYMHRI